jgi:hypothetical protein
MKTHSFWFLEKSGKNTAFGMHAFVSCLIYALLTLRYIVIRTVSILVAKAI